MVDIVVDEVEVVEVEVVEVVVVVVKSLWWSLYYYLDLYPKTIYMI